MKRKKLIIISIVVLLVIGVFLLIQRLPVANEYKQVLEKIDSDKSFNLLIVNESPSNKTTSDTANIFEYYKDVYGLNFIRVNGNSNNLHYLKIIKKIDVNLSGNEPIIFSMFSKGNSVSNMIGEFPESFLKEYLISNKLIDKEYKDIDTAISTDFKKNLKKDKGYCILYIESNSNDLFAYRRLLVKNKVKSLIMYEGQTNQMEVEKYFKKELGLSNDVSDKLPMTIKIKNGKILYSHTNVTLNDLVQKCK